MQGILGGSSVPLVDVQVARHVGGQACRGRRPSHGLQGKIVSPALLHAEVPEVEALGSQAVGRKQRLRGGQVAAVAPGAGRDGRRVHGRERRRHLHCEVLGAWPWSWSWLWSCRATGGNERLRPSSSGLSLDDDGGWDATGDRSAGDRHTRQKS